MKIGKILLNCEEVNKLCVHCGYKDFIYILIWKEKRCLDSKKKNTLNKNS